MGCGREAWRRGRRQKKSEGDLKLNDVDLDWGPPLAILALLDPLKSSSGNAGPSPTYLGLFSLYLPLVSPAFAMKNARSLDHFMRPYKMPFRIKILRGRSENY